MKLVDNVTPLPVITRLDIDAERVLKAAIDSTLYLQKVVVLGYDAEGEFYFASSIADGGTVLWLMEVAKKKLLEIGGDKE